MLKRQPRCCRRRRLYLGWSSATGQLPGCRSSACLGCFAATLLHMQHRLHWRSSSHGQTQDRLLQTSRRRRLQHWQWKTYIVCILAHRTACHCPGPNCPICLVSASSYVKGASNLEPPKPSEWLMVRAGKDNCCQMYSCATSLDSRKGKYSKAPACAGCLYRLKVCISCIKASK